MHRTDVVTLTIQKKRNKPRVFTISEDQGTQIEQWLNKGPTPGIPASIVLPELGDATLRPAISLRGSRHKARLTQVELAEQLGVQQAHLSQMENGKRPIGKKMALRLARIFSCDYRAFL